MKSKRVERKREAARVRKIVQEVARKVVSKWFEERQVAMLRSKK